MERRLLLVFALTFLVIVLFQPILKKYLPQPSSPAQPTQSQPQTAPQAAAIDPDHPQQYLLRSSCCPASAASRPAELPPPGRCGTAGTPSRQHEPAATARCDRSAAAPSRSARCAGPRSRRSAIRPALPAPCDHGRTFPRGILKHLNTAAGQLTPCSRRSHQPAAARMQESASSRAHGSNPVFASPARIPHPTRSAHNINQKICATQDHERLPNSGAPSRRSARPTPK